MCVWGGRGGGLPESHTVQQDNIIDNQDNDVRIYGVINPVWTKVMI